MVYIFLYMQIYKRCFQILLIYLYGINRDTNIENKFWTQWKKERAQQVERNTDIYTTPGVKQPAGSCSVNQGAQLSALWWPRPVGWGGGWGGGSSGSRHMYTYGWFMLLYSRSQNSILDQLYSN